MSELPGELPSTLADRLHDALLAFSTCVGMAVPDICSYGLTIGESYVPFNPDPEDDCDEDDVACSQIWVRVEAVSETPGTPGGWGGDCAATLTLDIEVGVLRCLEVPENGEAPTASEMLIASTQAMSDMTDIRCAATSCSDGVWAGPVIVGPWRPLGPLGGQYGGLWTFTVEID